VETEDAIKSIAIGDGAQLDSNLSMRYARIILIYAFSSDQFSASSKLGNFDIAVSGGNNHKLQSSVQPQPYQLILHVLI